MTGHGSVERYLRGLPAASPPPALGVRIIERHARRRRRRRQGWALAAAASLALACARLWWPMPGNTGFAGQVTDASLREVRSLDRQLQARYSGHADTADLDRLWRLRQAAMRPIEHPGAGPSRLVRL